MAVITTIRSAFGFLTRLPVGPWPLQNDLNGISAWLPLVGLVVGGLAGGLTWTTTLLFPPPGLRRYRLCLLGSRHGRPAPGRSSGLRRRASH